MTIQLPKSLQSSLFSFPDLAIFPPKADLTAEIASRGKRQAVEGGQAVAEWGAWDPTNPLLRTLSLV